MTLDSLEKGGQPPCITPNMGKAEFDKDMISAFFI